MKTSQGSTRTDREKTPSSRMSKKELSPLKQRPQTGDAAVAASHALNVHDNIMRIVDTIYLKRQFDRLIQIQTFRRLQSDYRIPPQSSIDENTDREQCHLTLEELASIINSSVRSTQKSPGPYVTADFLSQVIDDSERTVGVYNRSVADIEEMEDGEELILHESQPLMQSSISQRSASRSKSSSSVRTGKSPNSAAKPATSGSGNRSRSHSKATKRFFPARSSIWSNAEHNSRVSDKKVSLSWPRLLEVLGNIRREIEGLDSDVDVWNTGNYRRRNSEVLLQQYVRNESLEEPSRIWALYHTISRAHSVLQVLCNLSFRAEDDDHGNIYGTLERYYKEQYGTVTAESHISILFYSLVYHHYAPLCVLLCDMFGLNVKPYYKIQRQLLSSDYFVMRFMVSRCKKFLDHVAEGNSRLIPLQALLRIWNLSTTVAETIREANTNTVGDLIEKEIPPAWLKSSTYSYYHYLCGKNGIFDLHFQDLAVSIDEIYDNCEFVDDRLFKWLATKWYCSKSPLLYSRLQNLTYLPNCTRITGPPTTIIPLQQAVQTIQVCLSGYVAPHFVWTLCRLLFLCPHFRSDIGGSLETDCGVFESDLYAHNIEIEQPQDSSVSTYVDMYLVLQLVGEIVLKAISERRIQLRELQEAAKIPAAKPIATEEVISLLRKCIGCDVLRRGFVSLKTLETIFHRHKWNIEMKCLSDPQIRQRLMKESFSRAVRITGVAVVMVDYVSLFTLLLGNSSNVEYEIDDDTISIIDMTVDDVEENKPIFDHICSLVTVDICVDHHSAEPHANTESVQLYQQQQKHDWLGQPSKAGTVMSASAMSTTLQPPVGHSSKSSLSAFPSSATGALDISDSLVLRCTTPSKFDFLVVQPAPVMRRHEEVTFPHHKADTPEPEAGRGVFIEESLLSSLEGKTVEMTQNIAQNFYVALTKHQQRKYQNASRLVNSWREQYEEQWSRNPVRSMSSIDEEDTEKKPIGDKELQNTGIWSISKEAMNASFSEELLSKLLSETSVSEHDEPEIRGSEDEDVATKAAKCLTEVAEIPQVKYRKTRPKKKQSAPKKPKAAPAEQKRPIADKERHVSSQEQKSAKMAKANKTKHGELPNTSISTSAADSVLTTPAQDHYDSNVTSGRWSLSDGGGESPHGDIVDAAGEEREEDYVDDPVAESLLHEQTQQAGTHEAEKKKKEFSRKKEKHFVKKMPKEKTMDFQEARKSISQQSNQPIAPETPAEGTKRGENTSRFQRPLRKSPESSETGKGSDLKGWDDTTEPLLNRAPAQGVAKVEEHREQPKEKLIQNDEKTEKGKREMPNRKIQKHKKVVGTESKHKADRESVNQDSQDKGKTHKGVDRKKDVDWDTPVLRSRENLTSTWKADQDLGYRGISSKQDMRPDTSASQEVRFTYSQGGAEEHEEKSSLSASSGQESEDNDGKDELTESADGIQYEKGSHEESDFSESDENNEHRIDKEDSFEPDKQHSVEAEGEPEEDNHLNSQTTEHTSEATLDETEVSNPQTKVSFDAKDVKKPKGRNVIKRRRRRKIPEPTVTTQKSKPTEAAQDKFTYVQKDQINEYTGFHLMSGVTLCDAELLSPDFEYDSESESLVSKDTEKEDPISPRIVGYGDNVSFTVPVSPPLKLLYQVHERSAPYSWKYSDPNSHQYASKSRSRKSSMDGTFAALSNVEDFTNLPQMVREYQLAFDEFFQQQADTLKSMKFAKEPLLYASDSPYDLSNFGLNNRAANDDASTSDVVSRAASRLSALSNRMRSGHSSNRLVRSQSARLKTGNSGKLLHGSRSRGKTAPVDERPLFSASTGRRPATDTAAHPSHQPPTSKMIERRAQKAAYKVSGNTDLDIGIPEYGGWIYLKFPAPKNIEKYQPVITLTLNYCPSDARDAAAPLGDDYPIKDLQVYVNPCEPPTPSKYFWRGQFHGKNKNRVVILPNDPHYLNETVTDEERKVLKSQNSSKQEKREAKLKQDEKMYFVGIFFEDKYRTQMVYGARNFVLHSQKRQVPTFYESNPHVTSSSDDIRSRAGTRSEKSFREKMSKSREMSRQEEPSVSILQESGIASNKLLSETSLIDEKSSALEDVNGDKTEALTRTSRETDRSHNRSPHVERQDSAASLRTTGSRGYFRLSIDSDDGTYLSGDATNKSLYSKTNSIRREIFRGHKRKEENSIIAITDKKAIEESLKHRAGGDFVNLLMKNTEGFQGVFEVEEGEEIYAEVSAGSYKYESPG